MVNISQHSPNQLSRREQQIIDGLLKAQTVKEIAFDLRLTPNTVKDYLRMVYVKLNVHSARELCLKLSGVSQCNAPAQFYESILHLLTSREPADLFANILLAAMRCTDSRDASVWLFDQCNQIACVRAVAGGRPPTPPLPVNVFFQSVFDHGFAHFSACQVRSHPQHTFLGFGFRGDIVGARVETDTDRYALVAADPVCSNFGEAELQAVRVLARIAEIRMGVGHGGPATSS